MSFFKRKQFLSLTKSLFNGSQWFHYLINTHKQIKACTHPKISSETSYITKKKKEKFKTKNQNSFKIQENHEIDPQSHTGLLRTFVQPFGEVFNFKRPHTIWPQRPTSVPHVLRSPQIKSETHNPTIRNNWGMTHLVTQICPDLCHFSKGNSFYL